MVAPPPGPPSRQPPRGPVGRGARTAARVLIGSCGAVAVASGAAAPAAAPRVCRPLRRTDAGRLVGGDALPPPSRRPPDGVFKRSSRAAPPFLITCRGVVVVAWGAAAPAPARATSRWIWRAGRGNWAGELFCAPSRRPPARSLGAQLSDGCANPHRVLWSRGEDPGCSCPRGGAARLPAVEVHGRGALGWRRSYPRALGTACPRGAALSISPSAASRRSPPGTDQAPAWLYTPGCLYRAHSPPSLLGAGRSAGGAQNGPFWPTAALAAQAQTLFSIVMFFLSLT